MPLTRARAATGIFGRALDHREEEMVRAVAVWAVDGALVDFVNSRCAGDLRGRARPLLCGVPGSSAAQRCNAVQVELHLHALPALQISALLC